MLLLRTRKNSFYKLYSLIYLSTLLINNSPPTRLELAFSSFRHLRFRVHALLDISLHFSQQIEIEQQIVIFLYPASYPYYRVKILIRNVIHGEFTYAHRKSVLHLGSDFSTVLIDTLRDARRARQSFVRVLTRQRTFVLRVYGIYLLSNWYEIINVIVIKLSVKWQKSIFLFFTYFFLYLHEK